MMSHEEVMVEVEKYVAAPTVERLADVLTVAKKLNTVEKGQVVKALAKHRDLHGMTSNELRQAMKESRGGGGQSDKFFDEMNNFQPELLVDQLMQNNHYSYPVGLGYFHIYNGGFFKEDVVMTTENKALDLMDKRNFDIDKVMKFLKFLSLIHI